jgi:hypothetical protein
MGVWIYPLYMLLYLGLLVYGARRVYPRLRQVSTVLIWLVALGVFYDNLILSIGGLIGAGARLEGLSWPRFYLHQLVLPLIIPAAYLQAQRSGQRWAQPPAARWTVLLFTAATITLGILTRLIPMSLQPEIIDGVLRYTASGISGPPLVSLLSIGFALVMGALHWRRNGWPWLFWVSLAVFIVEGLPVQAVRLLLGSGIELLFMWVILRNEFNTSSPLGGGV